MKDKDLPNDYESSSLEELTLEAYKIIEDLESQKVLPYPLSGILHTAIELYFFFLIFLKVEYKFFAASFRFPFCDKK